MCIRPQLALFLVVVGCTSEPAVQAPAPVASSATVTAPPPPIATAVAPPPPTTAPTATEAGPSALPPPRPGPPGAILGKVTLVHFWATWCAPCVKAFPAFEVLYEKYRVRGFDITAFAEEEEPKPIAAFVKATGATFPVKWDKDHAAVSAWNAASMPASYLVDRHGAVRYTHQGYAPGDEVVMEKEIDELLAEP